MTDAEWRKFIDDNDGLGPAMAHKLMDKLDEANHTIEILRESRQVIYDRAIQHENTIAKKDAEIERLRGVLIQLRDMDEIELLESGYVIEQALEGRNG